MSKFQHLHINNPKLIGSVHQSCGNQYVGIGCLKLPGASGLMNPSNTMIDTIPKHEAIPRILVILRIRRGTKLRGKRMNPHIIFNAVLLVPGNNTLRVSAKRTTNATQAPISSMLNSSDTTYLIFVP
jgi:hypothetical protein